MNSICAVGESKSVKCGRSVLLRCDITGRHGSQEVATDMAMAAIGCPEELPATADATPGRAPSSRRMHKIEIRFLDQPKVGALSRAEAAAYLSIGQTKLWQLVSTGQIRKTAYDTYPVEELDRHLREEIESQPLER